MTTLKEAGSSELMQGYVFHEGNLPSQYHFVFAVAVFNRPEYRLLFTRDGWFSFYILDPQTMSVHGHVHFHVHDQLAVTPLRAPFGSVETSPAVSAETLAHFLRFAESRLLQAGVLKIVIKNPPDVYHPVTARILHALLFNAGYTIASAETTSVIVVSSALFSDVVHRRKRRKLKQSGSLPFVFAQLDTNSLPDVYDFISVCRISKKYRLSITLDDLRRTADEFPEEYHIFGVYYSGQLVAASIAIQVNDKVLYHFISDHIRKIGSFSPALVLMEGIYNFCIRRKLQILDLGTSAPDAVPNARLLNFKKELGAKVSDKFTFMKIAG